MSDLPEVNWSRDYFHDCVVSKRLKTMLHLGTRLHEMGSEDPQSQSPPSKWDTPLILKGPVVLHILQDLRVQDYPLPIIPKPKKL